MKDIDWKILITLYEKKSMTKAAEALYMTQSALTKRIHLIEDEWDIKVVHRNSHGVTFTDEGKYLVNKSTIMLDFLNEIEEHFAQNRAQKPLLRVGLPNSFARLHMPELLKEYLSEFNNIQIETNTNTSDVIVNQLTNGNIDIGFVCGDFPFLGEKVCLFNENLYMVTPKGISIDEIIQFPLIESYFNALVKLTVTQWWKNHFNVMPQETHRVPYADIAIEMVENGLGISFVFGDKWKINSDKAQKLLVYDGSGQVVSRNVWMMVSDECFSKPEIMDFVSFVENYYKVNC